MKVSIYKIQFILTLIVFGTIGIVTKFIHLSASAIVFYRAFLGALFLIFVSIIIKRKFNFVLIKKYFKYLLLAGIFMGLNWVFQFESFKVSSVSIGTVSYNTMPIFVIALSPLFFKERLSISKVICVIIATIGVVLVSNVINVGISSNEVFGCALGLCGALFYALVVIVTKRIESLDSWDKVIIEFVIAGIIMIPYMLFIQHSGILFEPSLSKSEFVIGIVLLIILCFIHTGFFYIIYFNSVDKLKAQEVAILTYIDPMVALILSAVILKEKLNLMQIFGALCILVSTIINEYIEYKKYIK